MNSSRATGYLAILGYCLVTAYYCLAIHNQEQQVHPNLLTFFIFTFCVIFFLSINFLKLKEIFQKVKKDPLNLFVINFTTAIIWIATAWSLKYTQPIIFVTLFMTTIPIFNFILQFFIKKTFNVKELILVLLLSGIVVVFISLANIIDYTSLFNRGIILSLFASLAGVIYLISSYRLQKNVALTASQLMAVRFYLLIILTATLVLIRMPFSQMPIVISQINFIDIIELALLTTAFPLYLLQLGISRLGASTIAYFTPITIIFTFIFEVYFGAISLNWQQIIVILVLLALITGLNKVQHAH